MSADNYILHYGTPRHSGRYPWGSGENPYQRTKLFKSTVSDLKKQGLTEREIAQQLGITNRYGQPDVARLRASVSRAKTDILNEETARVKTLRDKGYSWQAIADEVGLKNESTARNYYKKAASGKIQELDLVTTSLKNSIAKYDYIDVGPGTELEVGTTAERLKTAVLDLEAQGYTRVTPKVSQAGQPGKSTTYTILAAPGKTYKDVMNAIKNDEIGYISERVEKNPETGELKTYKKETPKSVSSDRVYIRYNEDGGIDKDGVIELRKGVQELDLGSSHYAQVRIAVDGTHYIKGMAMYSDNIPKGYDIVFNTNKHVGTPKISNDKDNTVLKQMKVDKKTGKINVDNPFGSTTVQHHYISKDGKEELSALSIVGYREGDEHKEGSWGKWSKQISAQFLSKQSPSVAKKQLDISYKTKLDEYNDILNLTNPIVKKKKLAEFADLCDSAAVDLKATGFPRQATHVILPFADMKANEIYAPNYKNGEEVALVRFPHAGTFEIPTLKVNNKPSVGSAYSLINGARDAVGINPKVASILSGADFDGDTVVVIPTKNQHLQTRKELEKTGKLTSSLKNLQNFEPKEIYTLPEDAPRMKESTKQLEMGKVSNLITDMTIKGANSDEIARAVKHSMVVIDAEKHHLDYQKSYVDNGIDEIKKKYQNNGNGKYGGASTLISRSKSQEMVPKRKDWFLAKNSIDEKGNKLYSYYDTNKPQDKKYVEYQQIREKEINPKTGKEKWGEWRSLRKSDILSDKTEVRTVTRHTESTKMAETNDAMTLLSGPNKEGSPIEKVYGEYANKLKSLANNARKEYISTKGTVYKKSAAEAYKAEVESLNQKLYLANKAKPNERHAQIIANKVTSEIKASNPDISKKDLKKYQSQALNDARLKVNNGQARYRIDITPKEWEAIQSGAFTNEKASSILENAKSEQVTEYAMPKNKKVLSTTKINRIKAMKSNGWTAAEIADALGVSTSTVYGALDS